MFSHPLNPFTIFFLLQCIFNVPGLINTFQSVDEEAYISAYQSISSSDITHEEYLKIIDSLYGKAGNDMVIRGKDYRLEFFNKNQILARLQQKKADTPAKNMPDDNLRSMLYEAIGHRSDADQKDIKKIRVYLKKGQSTSLYVQKLYKRDRLRYRKIHEVADGIVFLSYYNIMLMSQHSDPDSDKQILPLKAFISDILSIDPLQAKSDPEVINRAIVSHIDSMEDKLWAAELYYCLAKTYSTGAKGLLKPISPLNAIVDKKYCVYTLGNSDKVRFFITKSKTILEDNYSFLSQFSYERFLSSEEKVERAQMILDHLAYLDWLLNVYDYNLAFMTSYLYHQENPNKVTWANVMLEHLLSNSNTVVFCYRKVGNTWMFDRSLNNRNAKLAVQSLNKA